MLHVLFATLSVRQRTDGQTNMIHDSIQGPCVRHCVACAFHVRRAQKGRWVTQCWDGSLSVHSVVVARHQQVSVHCAESCGGRGQLHQRVVCRGHPSHSGVGLLPTRERRDDTASHAVQRRRAQLLSGPEIRLQWLPVEQLLSRDTQPAADRRRALPLPSAGLGHQKPIPQCARCVCQRENHDKRQDKQVCVPGV